MAIAGAPVLAGCAPKMGKLDCRVLLMQPLRYGAPLNWIPLYANGWPLDLWYNGCARQGFEPVKSPPPKWSMGGYRDVQIILNPNNCTATYTSDVSGDKDWWAARFEVI